MVLALTICEICPPSEVEIMISVLLNVFDTRASLLNLIKLMIEREVSHTGIIVTVIVLSCMKLIVSQMWRPTCSGAIQPVHGFYPLLQRSMVTTICEI